MHYHCDCVQTNGNHCEISILTVTNESQTVSAIANDCPILSVSDFWPIHQNDSMWHYRCATENLNDFCDSIHLHLMREFHCVILNQNFVKPGYQIEMIVWMKRSCLLETLIYCVCHLELNGYGF